MGSQILFYFSLISSHLWPFRFFFCVQYSFISLLQAKSIGLFTLFSLRKLSPFFFNIRKAISIWVAEPPNRSTLSWAPASPTLTSALLPFHFPALKYVSLPIFIFQSRSVNVPFLFNIRTFLISACPVSCGQSSLEDCVTGDQKILVLSGPLAQGLKKTLEFRVNKRSLRVPSGH